MIKGSITGRSYHTQPTYALDGLNPFKGALQKALKGMPYTVVQDEIIIHGDFEGLEKRILEQMKGVIA